MPKANAEEPTVALHEVFELGQGSAPHGQPVIDDLQREARDEGPPQSQVRVRLNVFSPQHAWTHNGFPLSGREHTEALLQIHRIDVTVRRHVPLDAAKGKDALIRVRRRLRRLPAHEATTRHH